jgi:hypothetical protein
MRSIALGLIRFRRQLNYAADFTVTSPQKLDGFQLEEVASTALSVLTVRANSIGVRLPIELWGRLSL